MLLLRAFYAKFGNMQDDNSKSTRERIAQCLWKTNEFGQANMNVLKIDSEVATDNDKDEFLEILKTGIVEKEQKSNYAKNYRFFQEKIDKFLNDLENGEEDLYETFKKAEELENYSFVIIDNASKLKNHEYDEW